ncbi:MAG: hypothetical protein ACYC6V_07750 [Bacillota bacterium]
MSPSDFALTQDETEAMVCLRELIALARAGAPVWPGWDPGLAPFLLYKPSGNAFLVNHPFPPAEFYLVNLGGALGKIYYYHGELRKLRRAGSGEINGFETAVVPIALGTGLSRSEVFLARLAGEAFHIHQRSLGIFPPLAGVSEAYPELSPENNALGNLEGRVLYEALALAAHAGVAREDVAPLAREFLAVRQARDKVLSWEMVQYEQTAEAYDGLAAYAEERLLAFGAGPTYTATRDWRDFFGRERLEQGGEEVARRRERLKVINQHGEGAVAERFYLTGAAIAHLLDTLQPRWPAALGQTGTALTDILAEAAAYVPAAMPELLAVAQGRHGYEAQYQDERGFSAAEAAKREELLDSVLSQPGRRFFFDLSGVRLTGSDIEPAGVERIDETRRVHKRRCTFFYRETMLDFRGLAVVEDRVKRSLLVIVPPRDLDFRVDHAPYSPSEDGRFHQRLELTGPGIKVIASSGAVEYDEGAVYVRIER